mgnify:CR=1 FL=1
MLARIKRNQSGMTITELVITISLIGILSIGLLTSIAYYYISVRRNQLYVNMTVDSQSLLRATVEELRYGSGVRATNTIDDPNGPAGGWNTSNDSFVIIIAQPAQDSARDYIINPLTGAPYNNELVYFKEGSTLFKRTLAHPDATDNNERTTCPKALESPSCSADSMLTDNLDDMIFTLYDQDSVVTTDPLLARSVNIYLALRRITHGNELALDNNIRVTLRNRYQ